MGWGRGGERQSKMVLAACTNLNGKFHGVEMPTSHPPTPSGHSIPLVQVPCYASAFIFSLPIRLLV